MSKLDPAAALIEAAYSAADEVVDEAEANDEGWDSVFAKLARIRARLNSELNALDRRRLN